MDANAYPNNINGKVGGNIAYFRKKLFGDFPRSDLRAAAGSSRTGINILVFADVQLREPGQDRSRDER